MKITPKDMDAVRNVMRRGYYGQFDDQSLMRILARIYDRGFDAGYEKGYEIGARPDNGPGLNECPYTFAHTREWCGYSGCRES